MYKIRQNPKPPKIRYKWIWDHVCSIGRFDTWNVFVCIFEDFKELMLKFEIVMFRIYIGIACQFSSMLGSLQTPSGLCAHHRRFVCSEQKHAPDVLEHVFCRFCNLFSGLGVPWYYMVELLK